MRTKPFAGCAEGTEKELHTPRSDSSADPQCKLRCQPQKGTNTPGSRVRVPSHGAVCVTIAKHEREEHGYSWVTSLTNGTSAYPCVPCRWEQGKGGEGPLHGLAGHLGLLWDTQCWTSSSFPTTAAQPLSLGRKLATVQAEAVECCCCCWSAVPLSPYTDGSS